MTQNTEFAESIALSALTYLAASEPEIRAFLVQTGTSEQDLRREIENPGFLESILDFILSDEKRLVSFCEQTGIHPGIPLKARQVLPGGAVGNY